ncbi:MAG: YdcF family protein [Candidatus Acidiferrales bacterium]
MTILAGRMLADPVSQRGGIIFRFLFLIFLLFCLVALYIVRHPLLRVAGNFWVDEDSPEISDAIVVLAGDNYDADRAARAAELFKAGWAPRIVASGHYLRPYASASEFEQRDLEQRGVPAAAIVPLPLRVGNTIEEAREVSEFLAAHRWRKILLVTSNYHTRRSEYVYARLLAPGSELRVIAAPDSQYDPNNWWRQRESVKIFFQEMGGFGVTLWELRHSDVQVR